MADAIANTFHSLEKLTEAFGDLLPKQSREKDTKKLHKLLGDAKKANLISVYNIVESDAREFDEVLMRSTINRLKGTGAGRISAAPHIAVQLLSSQLRHTGLTAVRHRDTARSQSRRCRSSTSSSHGTEPTWSAICLKAFGTTRCCTSECSSLRCGKRSGTARRPSQRSCSRRALRISAGEHHCTCMQCCPSVVLLLWFRHLLLYSDCKTSFSLSAHCQVANQSMRPSRCTTGLLRSAFGTSIDHGLRLSLQDLYSVRPIFAELAIAAQTGSPLGSACSADSWKG